MSFSCPNQKTTCLGRVKDFFPGEAINPRHVLESSLLIETQSSREIDQDICDKEILDEEVYAAESTQNRKIIQSNDQPGPSGEVCTSDSEEDKPLAIGKSLFFKNKGKKGKCKSTVHQRVLQKMHKVSKRWKENGQKEDQSNSSIR